MRHEERLIYTCTVGKQAGDWGSYDPVYVEQAEKYRYHDSSDVTGWVRE